MVIASGIIAQHFWWNNQLAHGRGCGASNEWWRSFYRSLQHLHISIVACIGPAWRIAAEPCRIWASVRSLLNWTVNGTASRDN